MAGLTDKIDDIIYEHTEGGGGSGVAAAEIVSQLPGLLQQEGWLTPDALNRIQDPAEALAQAIQEEAGSLGCNGDHLSEKLSEMLDRIGTRYRHLLGDKGH